jgi:hypothetical protein
MKPHKKYFVLAGLLLFLFVSGGIAFASSSQYLTQAQKFINQNCNKKYLTDENALFCYLFNKSQEQDTKIATINATLSPIPSRVADLEKRVATLEAMLTSTPTTTPAPVPGTIIFAYNRPASFTSDGTAIPITPNYNWETMTMHVSTTGTLAGYSILVNLGQGDFEQVRIPCPSNACPDTTIPLLINDSQGNSISPRPIYKFSTGTSSGNITAIGTLNAEPDSHTIFLGNTLTLPYTSGDLVTSGYSQMEFTVAQANPQNLKSISIQQFDGTNWNEIQHISCDGGAVCPVQLVNIGSTFHRTRVVVDGSGSNAVIDYLIRP